MPVLLFFLYACSTDTRHASQQQAIPGFQEELEYSVFLDPPSGYRSFPFYSLNGRLDKHEISAQIKGFREAGLGGCYLHARTGLLTEYMGEDWWEVMDAAVKAAGKSGLHAWFYDEYNWPSGYAGGAVPAVGPEYRAKCLARLQRDTPLPEGSRVLAEDERYRYVEYTMQMGQPRFYGSCYVDLFNPEAVAEFIRQAYIPYAERYSVSKGGPGFGIFTDEPHIHARYFDRDTPHEGVLSYSPWVEERYNRTCGRELSVDLLLLFEEKDNWRQVRLDYYRAVALQFEESFSKQVSFFCARTENVFTGHYLGEDVLEKVRDRIGNAMLHYRNMQQPGMDHLGLTIRDRLITARSLSSAANQYGKARRLSEIFGISGQNMNFEDRKWIAGWHAILGVNHFCPHLTLYSMAGVRKRDYPPTFSYHQPYWKYNKAIEDYLGRISYATTVGRYDPQFLVIHPLESEYIKGKDDGNFSGGLLDLMEALQKAHYDYDLGDEQILADTARVEYGRLVVGAMAYANVILPDMIEIRGSTLELLMELSGQGGRLFNTGRFPVYLDGREAEERLAALRERVTDMEAGSLPVELPAYVKSPVMLDGDGAEKIWSHVRRTGQGYIVLLYNSSHTETIRVLFKSDRLAGGMLLWDPSAGKCYRLPDTGGEGCEIEVPSSSLVWLSDENAGKDLPGVLPYRLPPDRKTVLVLDGDWEGGRLQANAITLDFALYSTDGGKNFSEPEPVIGISSRFEAEAYSGPLTLKYPVQISVIPGSCRLVIEEPGIYRSVKVNGLDLAFADKDWWLDQGFRSTDITALLKEGDNEIELALDFIHAVPGSEIPEKRYGTEIESIYLTGDFGVEVSFPVMTMDSWRNATGDMIPRPVHGFAGFTLVAEGDVFGGDLTPEGYPFYAGEFEMLKRFSLDSVRQGADYFLEMPNTEAIACRVEVNGKSAGSLYWSPYRVEITPLLRTGENILKITLVNSLRNLLGPHHHPGAELTRVGPDSFTGAGGFPDPPGDRNWYDLRKKGEDLKLWTDTYYHIPFGFLEPVQITVAGTH